MVSNHKPRYTRNTRKTLCSIFAYFKYFAVDHAFCGSGHMRLGFQGSDLFA